ncbi:MAG TPA: GlxA family transcriptional regulator [Puia sp.]|nr:GlxA family transcriptional regulator [Puia sp.]
MNPDSEDVESPQKKRVVIVAMTKLLLLDFAGPADVFNYANKCQRDAGLPEGYEVLVVAPTADRMVCLATGIDIYCKSSAMDVTGPVDTLIIAGNDFSEKSTAALEPFYKWMAAVDETNTRRIGSVCGGAFVLAKVGLLNGRKATTHWNLGEKLKRAYPQVDVNSDPFFTVDGHVYTSAGVSSGIDLALALVEEDFGRDLATTVARFLVFYLNRPGFQSQFGSLLPAYESSNIAGKIDEWLKDHLQEKLDVAEMAEQLNMSVRNLTRVFRKHTGMSPAKYIEKVRVEMARKYLENTDMPLERIAEKCGLGGLVSMRRTFLRHLLTTPSDYRRAFRTSRKDTAPAESAIA